MTTQSGNIIVVSTAADGTLGNSSSYPGINTGEVFSPDGTEIVFSSAASNLVTGETYNTEEIFVKNLNTGAITLVSTAADGTQANGFCQQPVFSPDGTEVAFLSYATNLIPGLSYPEYPGQPGSHVPEIFVKDLVSGAITVVSTAADGTLANSGGNFGSTTQEPVFSPDGTELAFFSDASNLVPNDTNGTGDIFIKDLATGAITRVSTGSDGSQANGTSENPAFSPNGTKIVFESDASNLAPVALAGDENIFIKDLTTGIVTLLSAAANGTPGNSNSYQPVFSLDGTEVAFRSYDTNLVADGANPLISEIYVKNLTTGAVTVVSTAADGTLANGDCSEPIFSPDGTEVAFYSSATNLVSGVTTSQIFVKNLITGAITVASTAANGAQGNDQSQEPIFSPNGTELAFFSFASNLIPGDTQRQVGQIFLKQLQVPLPTVVADSAHASVAGTVTATAANGVLANDTDPIPNDTLVVSAIDGLASDVGQAIVGSYGTLTLNADGSYSYVADHSVPSNIIAQDVFTYTASEEAGGSATSTLTITVTQPGQTYIAGTPGQALTSGNGSVFLDGSLLQNETISAGNGNDAVLAGSNDTIKLGNGNDVVQAGNGNTISLGNGNDTVSTGSGSTVNLGNGNDTVHASANSTIKVGNGNDTIYAGASNLITLGLGNDTVAFGESPNPLAIGNETIKGFNAAHDIIQFNPALLVNYAAAMVTQVGANTVIQIDATDSVTLVGVVASSLSAHNFHFS